VIDVASAIIPETNDKRFLKDVMAKHGGGQRDEKGRLASSWAEMPTVDGGARARVLTHRPRVRRAGPCDRRGGRCRCHMASPMVSVASLTSSLARLAAIDIPL
jgi:hypothetical protein